VWNAKNCGISEIGQWLSPTGCSKGRNLMRPFSSSRRPSLLSNICRLLSVTCVYPCGLQAKDGRADNVSIHITLPDGSKRYYDDGATGFDVASDIGSRLAKAAVAVTVDGEMYDLHRPITSDASLSIVTETTEAGRYVLRHSAAHIMAQAVLGLFPNSSFAIGPPIQDGFYYDFSNDRPFTPEDLDAIEAKMVEIVAEDQLFERDEIPLDDAREAFSDHPFKLEIIDGVDADEGVDDDFVSTYRNDQFLDLCRGPHIPSTGRLKAFKLMRSAGAYWRGDENNPQLQRIYGTAWESKKALDAYVVQLEEAAQRDHRKLGAELDLFSFPSELGSGLAVWHPDGGILRRTIEDYSRRTHMNHGYEYVVSPHVAKADLWKTSGHLNFYSEGMYPVMELDGGENKPGQEYYVKPMNCPFHILIYRSRGRSYRELPLRLFELGTVYRYERSGVLHGLMRARGFTQDDSHIFTTEDDLADELKRLLDFVLMVLRDFGFDEFEADLSTRPPKFVGDSEMWKKAEAYLASSLDAAGLDYQLAPGEGAFYGPKIDIHIKDAIGRRWQLSTIQVDFAQPENFDIEYATNENTRERPVMIHRALLGSVERFVGILVEHYAGAFPMWLAPVQVTVVPVADRHIEYAHAVGDALGVGGVRVRVDESDETVGEKIRRAITHKHPAVIVVGDNDVDNTTVGLRLRGQDKEERGVDLGSAVKQLVAKAEPPR
jgi:threonyl-tRNA synthetase